MLRLWLEQCFLPEIVYDTKSSRVAEQGKFKQVILAIRWLNTMDTTLFSRIIILDGLRGLAHIRSNYLGSIQSRFPRLTVLSCSDNMSSVWSIQWHSLAILTPVLRSTVPCSTTIHSLTSVARRKSNADIHYLCIKSGISFYITSKFKTLDPLAGWGTAQ